MSLQEPDKLRVTHDYPITSMDRNPFLNDLLLATGGTRFTMLKVNEQSGGGGTEQKGGRGLARFQTHYV